MPELFAIDGLSGTAGSADPATDDLIAGGAGDDRLNGGGGADTLRGLTGNDTLFGGSGEDRLEGGAGNDVLVADAGADTIYGGSGADSFSIFTEALTPGQVVVIADFEAGLDRMGYRGTLSPTILRDGADALLRWADGRAVRVLGTTVSAVGRALTFNPYREFGTGWDRVDPPSAADRTVESGAHSSLLPGALPAGTAPTQTVDAADPRPLTGDAGDDFLSGAASADVPLGLDGNDILVGGAGDDRLNGNQGQDTLSGGTGNDTLYGGRGADILVAEEADDVVNGNLGNDSVDGGAGHDTLFGGQDDDLLLGGEGNDALSGDLGNDTLTGGAGGDRFLGGAGHDIVTDFSAGDGDRIVSPLARSIALDSSGNALISFTGGSTLTLQGITPSSVQVGWFAAG